MDEFEELLRLAERGDAEAQFHLGKMHLGGEGVPQNDAEAEKWWLKSAEQGFADAQFSLGIMYLGGEGVPKNDAEAVKWFRKAADQGHVGALYNLGVMYVKGDGVPENYVMAHMCWSIAKAREEQDAVSFTDAVWGPPRGCI